MRHGNVCAVLAAFAIAGCASSGPLEDMVGYVPPTSLPAQPKRTLVAEERERVWDQLVSFLDDSAFEVDHIDEAQSLLVARYSGDPEPYIDCGSIVTHQNGALGQIAGSAPTVALNYELKDKPVILNRALSLDSRIIIRLSDQARGGTVIQTDITYVVTKTVDVADPSGQAKEGNRETVSFEAGNRGEFSKGTTCQPNGSLDLAVLQSLPNVVGSDEIDRAALSDFETETAKIENPNENEIVTLVEETNGLTSSELASVDDEEAETTLRDVEQLDAAALPEPPSSETTYDWVLPEQGLPTAALPSSDLADEAGLPATTVPKTALEAEPAKDATENVAALAPRDRRVDQPIASEDTPTTIVDDTTRKLLNSLDCAGEEWHFCDLVEITAPYRKRNIEQLFGLTVNTTENFASQVVGRDLKLDILFPSFPSHLHVIYAKRDGTIDHVMTTSEIWPADLAHQLTQSGKTIPGPPGLAMIIAIATEGPLFDDIPKGAEDATTYIDRLKQQLSGLETESSIEPIAASQLLIFVEKAEG